MNEAPAFPVHLMAQFVDDLKGQSGDWMSLLLDPRYQGLRARQRWFGDRQKAMFYRLLSPRRRQAFLELQAGSGIVSACLSEDYERGYSLESRAAFADFIELRFRSEGVVNVDVLRGGNAGGIPLGESSVDLVAIDSPISAGPGPDAAAVLDDVRRCLRPGGRLIMAVDNSWQLPRPLTSIELSGDGDGSASGMKARSPPGYCRLLRRAGFDNPRYFVVRPRRQLPIDIYSPHREALELLYRKYDRGSPVRRMLKWASGIARVPYLGAFFQPSYYLLGERRA